MWHEEDGIQYFNIFWFSSFDIYLCNVKTYDHVTSLSKRRRRRTETTKYSNGKGHSYLDSVVLCRLYGYYMATVWPIVTIILPMTCHCHRLRLPINLITTQPFAHAGLISVLYFKSFELYFETVDRICKTYTRLSTTLRWSHKIAHFPSTLEIKYSTAGGCH